MVDDPCQLTISLAVEVDFRSLEAIGIFIDCIRAYPQEKFIVGLSGSTNELGQWNPEKGILCKHVRTSADGVETWGCRFTSALTSSFEYRYFLAELKENNDEYSDSNIFRVLAWESRLAPRTFSLLDYLNSSDKRSLTYVKFGVYGDGRFVQRGWIHSNSEVHIRLSGSACKFFNWSALSKRQQHLYVSCSRYVVQSPYLDEFETDTVTQDISHQTRIIAHTNHDVVENARLNAPVMNMPFSSGAVGHTQPVLLSTLEINRCRVHRGERTECWGTAYKPGDDLTFYIETNDVETIAVVVEFYRSTANDSKLIFIGSARFGPFEATYGRKASQILNTQQIPVGDLRIQYLIIHPMTNAPPPSLAITYQHHWKKGRRFEIGHRGMGTSFVEKSQRETKIPSTTKENTLDSFREAMQHGADFVEMDVQLTKDHHVIVYHDYEAVIISKKKRAGGLSYLPIAIKDLNYDDLRELKVHHSSVLQEEHTHEKMDEEDLDPIELQSFPLLRSCFQEVDPELGFVIEVKYPMDLKSGRSEMPNFFEYNFYVDTILREILTYAGKRRILLSCFDPNVCAMLQLKQNIYPVFQLGIDPDYADSRQADFPRLFWSAISHQLLGVCLESDKLLEQPDVLQLAHMHDLIVLAWGEAVNHPDKRAQLSALGVDGMIYDRLYEHKEKGSLNVFKQKATVSCHPVHSPAAGQHMLGPCYNVGDVQISPAQSVCAITPESPDMANLKGVPQTTKKLHSPTHVAIVKECVELERLSHTNSTTTCESMPQSDLMSQTLDEFQVTPTAENHDRVDARGKEDLTPVPEESQTQNDDGSTKATQRALPLITLA